MRRMRQAPLGKVARTHHLETQAHERWVSMTKLRDTVYRSRLHKWWSRAGCYWHGRGTGDGQEVVLQRERGVLAFGEIFVGRVRQGLFTLLWPWYSTASAMPRGIRQTCRSTQVAGWDASGPGQTCSEVVLEVLGATMDQDY